MNFLTRFSLKNTSAIVIMCILLILGGTYSSLELKKEEMPDMSFPIVAVITAYPGAAPRDVQDKITKPFENLISSVDGIKSVNSTSSENISAIIVQFDFSANMDDSQRKIEGALKNATIPEGAIAPKVTRFDFNSIPMLSVSISNDKVAAEDLEQKVRDNILTSVSSIGGVAQAQLASDSQKAVYVKLLPEKLKEYNLTSQQVMQLLQANNVAFPTGSVSLNETIQPIRVSGKFNSLAELKNMQLPVMPNTQDALKSTFTQMGNGMVSLGQGMASLGQAVGMLGQGMSGMNQALNGQIQLLSAIQETQAQLFAAKLALNEANQTLKDDSATPEQKAAAQATQQQLTQQIQIGEVALAQMQGQLKGIQAAMAQASQQAPTSQMPTGKPAKSFNPASASSADVELKQVALSELAEISIGSGDTTSFSRMNGNPGVLLQVYKTQDANTVDVSDAVQKKLQEIKTSLPEGTQLNVVEDGADPVKESINGMLREGLLGALFAFIVILLFLRNIRSTLIAVVSIPLSVFITLIFLKQFNITLNILTLGGLSVATGRIVDDSIVVIENIYRRLHTDKVRDVELIKQSAKEVTSAITSSTLTTVAVFLPIGFVSGFAGVMFRPFAITVAIALLSSLLVAVTVIPVLSKVLLLKAKKITHQEAEEGRLITKYTGLLSWALNHKLVTFVIASVLLGGSLALIPYIGTSFIPEVTAKKLSISIDYPAGTDIQVVNKKAAEIEKLLSNNPQVEQYQTTVASASSSSNAMAALMTKSPGSIIVNLKEDANVNNLVKELKDQLLPKAEKAKIDIQQVQDSRGGGHGANNLQVMVIGDDLAKIKQGAELLTKEFASIQGLDHIANNLTDSKPEIAINVDQKKASSNALSAAQVGMSIRELLNDKAVTTMLVDNKSLDVRMGLKLDPVNKLNDVSSITIQGPMGSVKLSDIAEVKEVPGAVNITTSDGREFANVTATITEKNTGAVSQRVQAKLQEVKMPEGVKTEMGGVTQMMGDTFTQMGIAMLVAVFAVFLVMMIGLGGATASLAILFSLPLAAIGSFVALFVSGIVLDAPAMIGALMLIGIVVTNAIVLIDRVQQNRSEGIAIREALLEAGKIRMRPILMTAIATIAALLPLAFGLSKGTMISQSLAVVVIGGLTTSTLLTLVIVPVAYEMLENLKARAGWRSRICG